MNDQANVPAITTQQRAARVINPVEDVIPIFDTYRFEHYQRIATVMASASLIPDALRGAGGAEAIGNCFLVTALADRLGQDPFMLAQCCSVVHGRLMIEGKAVHAGIQHKGQANLKFYYTGERAKGDRRIYVSGKPLTQDEIASLKPGSYPYGCEDMIDGSIDEWKTLEKGGGVKAAWQGQQSEMQLVYRGTRTWARKNQPGIMLGVYTEDEMTDLEVRQSFDPAPKGRAKTDLRAKLAPPTEAQPLKEGFDPGHAERELAAHDPKTGEVEEETSPQDAATETAPAAEAEPALSDSATPAPSDTAEETSGAIASDAPPESDEPIEGTVLNAADAEERKPEPEDEAPPSPPPGVFATFWANVTATDSWAKAKPLVIALYKADDFKALEEDEQAALRAKIWNALKDMGAAADPAEQPTAFRLWLDTLKGKDDAPALEGTWRVLKAEPTFTGMATANQDFLEKTYNAALTKLRAGA
jgi:hypothetical protein